MQPFSLARIRSSPEYQKYHFYWFWGFCASYVYSRRHDFLLFVASFSRDRFVPCVKCYNFQTRPMKFLEFWPVRPDITPNIGGKRIWDDILKESNCNSRKTAVTRDTCKFSELTDVLQSFLCAQQGTGAACSDSLAEPYVSSAPGQNRHLRFSYRTPRERNLSSLPHLD